ncbi:MAG: hypothetical protein U9O50_04995 [Acidobacteriota bacterium]|nr:hypothetical protein [Acidobacteriota bacterium]
MKLLRRSQIENLAKFKSQEFLTTSLYLNTDKSRITKKEINLSFKNLMRNAKSQLEGMDLNKEKKDSLLQDIEKINRFFSQNIGTHNFAGLAIFSCSGQNFWQIFSLPDPPKNRMIFDSNPYVRPLSAILKEHHHICALLLDRKEAKIYDISMGEISLLKTLIGDVPSKVREGGWKGYESKRIERHIETHLRDYFKACAKMTFELSKKNNFDWFFLGCNEEYYTDFKELLHPYLQQRLKSSLKASPADPPDKVLKESLEVEKKIKMQEEKEALLRFVSELEKGGMATSGLKNTLRSLNQGEVQTLLVTRNFSMPGKICSRCNLLYVDEDICPSCKKNTTPYVDIIDESIEAAMEKNCEVKHITPPSQLRRYGNIGAFLRYKT